MVSGATMAAVIARPSSIAVLSRQKPEARSRWVLSPLAFSSSPASSTRKLVLYSKTGCCLCDGLKEKLQAAFLISGPDSLHDVDLQVRDITTNPEWEKAYQYEIPVLAKVLSDGREETLPRLSPRIGVELIQKKIAAALRQ
ncbi:uncharacterized protein LOC116138021 isoform X2 [Pistacia vera]|uniref:uncharacterized protein LOC116138021 isoform X2 n=1 Tax=Pistacia vera TaxID=55513 RepID=UPI001262B34E|nr:uncharacterized protein LOC116138021 isoform X2 [Pistacia vera]